MATKEKKEKNLNKIAGWLLFFIISTGIISPIMNIFQWCYGPLNDCAIGVVAAALGVGVAALMLTKTRYSLLVAKLFMFLVLAWDIMVIISVIGDPGSSLEGGPAFIGKIIWLIYLFRSKRVKAVYLSDKQQTSDA